MINKFMEAQILRDPKDARLKCNVVSLIGSWNRKMDNSEKAGKIQIKWGVVISNVPMLTS